MSREWVARLVMAKAILDEWSAGHTQDRRAAIAEMVPGDRIKAPGGMGEVSLSDPKGTYVVTDRAAFFRWVKAHAPHGLREAVDPGYEKAILAAGCDRDGVIPDGIELVVGQPVLTVKPSPETRALAKGRLPELEA